MTSSSPPRVTKFTNCFLLRDTSLVEQDLWIDGWTGQILHPQAAFYGSHITPDQVVDLSGKIISPGLIDVQLNGAHGFDFSVPSDRYADILQETNRQLVRSGVTSYLPTVTSQKAEVYHAVLPHLGSPGPSRRAEDGAESLGAHVEGPFLSPTRNGIHNRDVLLKAMSFSDLEDCYGKDNLTGPTATIKKITAAPELGKMMSLIPEIASRGITFSIGHSDASFSEAQRAAGAGAVMVTHLFNAMRSFGHRDPGIFGLLGQSNSRPTSPSSSQASTPMSSKDSSPRHSLCLSETRTNTSQEPIRPYFGLIADGIHLHPSSVKIAFNAYPEGAILVTDAMKLAGCPDGVYDWTNGDRIIKKGPVLTLEANGRIAGSAVTLIECVNNFIRFTGCNVAEALACVTSHPARMLGEDSRKGGLLGGMDADLVVLDADETGELKVEQVWKFGKRVH